MWGTKGSQQERGIHLLWFIRVERSMLSACCRCLWTTTSKVSVVLHLRFDHRHSTMQQAVGRQRSCRPSTRTPHALVIAGVNLILYTARSTCAIYGVATTSSETPRFHSQTVTELRRTTLSQTNHQPIPNATAAQPPHTWPHERRVRCGGDV